VVYGGRREEGDAGHRVVCHAVSPVWEWVGAWVAGWWRAVRVSGEGKEEGRGRAHRARMGEASEEGARLVGLGLLGRGGSASRASRKAGVNQGAGRQCAVCCAPSAACGGGGRGKRWHGTRMVGRRASVRVACCLLAHPGAQNEAVCHRPPRAASWVWRGSIPSKRAPPPFPQPHVSWNRRAATGARPACRWPIRFGWPARRPRWFRWTR
jgi:hypothetical protein